MKKLALCVQLSALSLLLAACNLPSPQADTVRNFTLSVPATAALDGATVRPVQLAGHLRGRLMAVRVDPAVPEEGEWVEAITLSPTLWTEKKQRWK